MFDLNSFRQKSPQQRFLFIFGLAMMAVYLGIAVVIIFFSELLYIDPEKFPQPYRIAFGVLLIVYALMRFSRLFKKDDSV